MQNNRSSNTCAGHSERSAPSCRKLHRIRGMALNQEPGTRNQERKTPPFPFSVPCSLFLVHLALVVLGLSLMPTTANAIPVRVRAGTTLRAHARFDEDERLNIRGQLSDDGRTPIEKSWIDLEGSGLQLNRWVRGCGSSRLGPSRQGKGIAVETSPAGEFCVLWRRAPDQGRLTLRFGGDAYHGASELAVAFNKATAQKLETALRFEPRPRILDLNQPTALFRAVLGLRQPTAHATRSGLPVLLVDERDTELSSAQTGGDGTVRFELATDRLGQAGYGTLTIRFAGNATLTEASDSQPITRLGRVKLALARPIEPAGAGEPVQVLVEVASPHGAVTDGVVEAVSCGHSLGSAPVVDGLAQLRVELGPNEANASDGKASDISLRYLPASPWWTPGPPLAVAIPVAPPSLAFRLVLSFVVLAVAGWITYSWRRARRPGKAHKPKMGTDPGVHVIKTRRRQTRWDGTVVDAHEACPLEGVEICVTTPTLERNVNAVMLHSCRTDQDGQFSFKLDHRPKVAQLEARLPTHSTERKELPPPGTLRIGLLTRRRNILRRFVAWARARGGAFLTPPEPTPAHVRRKARGQPGVREWATELEAAAFGPDEVDAAKEKHLEDIQPK